jgi:hypothetical protein
MPTGAVGKHHPNQRECQIKLPEFLMKDSIPYPTSACPVHRQGRVFSMEDTLGPYQKPCY